MFMFDCVPEPVCQTTSGNSPGCRLSITSSAAAITASAIFGSSVPSARLTRAALRLTSASACRNSGGIRSPEIAKCCVERCVCAPHKALAGTSIGPNVSRSVRVVDSMVSSIAETRLSQYPICANSRIVRRGRANNDFESTMSDTILFSRDGPIATITLNRPEKLNALTRPMWQRLGEVARGIEALPDIRCVILRGAGVQAFAPGNAISEFPTERSNVDQARRYGAVMHSTIEALWARPQPVIAM